MDRTVRRLAAVLAADVVGYSGKIEADESSTLAALKDVRATTIDPLLAENSGRIVKTMGDGFMASFGSAQRALQCAVALQRSFLDYSRRGPVDLRVRVGLNAGEPIAEQGDLYGTAVIMAARCAAQAKGGEILATDVVRQLVGGRGFEFEDRGPFAIRGFEDAVNLYEVKWRQD